MERVKYTLYLEPEQLALLKKENERTGAPVSELIRRAIDERYGRQRAKEERDTP